MIKPSDFEFSKSEGFILYIALELATLFF